MGDHSKTIMKICFKGCLGFSILLALDARILVVVGALGYAANVLGKGFMLNTVPCRDLHVLTRCQTMVSVGC